MLLSQDKFYLDFLTYDPEDRGARTLPLCYGYELTPTITFNWTLSHLYTQISSVFAVSFILIKSLHCFEFLYSYKLPFLEEIENLNAYTSSRFSEYSYFSRIKTYLY